MFWSDIWLNSIPHFEPLSSLPLPSQGLVMACLVTMNGYEFQIQGERGLQACYRQVHIS